MRGRMSLLKEFYHSPTKMLNRTVGWHKSRILKKSHICIACFPKSGSTYLVRTLQTILDYRFIHYAHMGDTEHDILEHALVDNLHTNTVTHLHMTASRSNLHYLHYYNIKTIVQIRNIYDCVISLRDHIVNESVVWPMAVVDDSFKEWEEKKQYDFIINNFIPWYIKFYVTWYKASKMDKLPVYWLQYEQLMNNKTEVIQDILTYFKVSFDDKKLVSILSEQKTKKGLYRFNVGISGRGESVLTGGQIDAIKGYAGYYPLVDFNSIGLAIN